MEVNLFSHETKEICNRQRNIDIRENKEINILKINFPSTHIHSTYNTQTYKRKLKKSEKFEIIGNTEETYPRPISK